MNASGLNLHIEDERATRILVSMLLAASGYEVAGAASGVHGIELTRGGFRPDVLIVDFDLGHGLNGADVAEQIASSLSCLPSTIMLTGNTGARLPRLVNSGLVLMNKPLNTTVMLAALPSLVQLSRAVRGLSTAAPTKPRAI